VLGTTLNQRFHLDKELGKGGMGAVYRATDLILQRTVAVKVLKEISGEEVGKRLRIEAQILARLLHDNIVRLYDFSIDGGTYFFVMEEVNGTSFQKRWKKLPLVERAGILATVADALDYAHHQGVIHRDVKPANILLTASDQPKLSDFGLSLTAESAAQESGIVRGTPHYMSPEQAKGLLIDYRSDLYALGVILYECATGSPPFTGQVMTIMAQHVNNPPAPPRLRNPEIGEEFERLILELMAKSPARRPGSGREVADWLRALIQSGRIAGADAPTAGGTTADLASPSSLGRSSSASRSSMGPASGTLLGSPTGPPPATDSDGLHPPSVGSGSLGRFGSAAARDMLQAVVAEPIALNADERYLCGHYLAYLLGGSRRRGFLMRRPLDPLNADRARLMLAMAFLTLRSGDEASLRRAAELMEQRPDIRPALSPIVVMKYLASRDHPKKRKQFRQIRQRLQEASPYAQRYLTDVNGVLNPGLMPQVLDDLRRVAPERTEVDDQLIERWNRVTDVWRSTPEFRESVLRYATRRAYLDPASSELWPEVVYPLIERARWQRHRRSQAEAVWDAVAVSLRLPDAGVRMDRAFRQAMPQQVVSKLDFSLDAFVEEPSLLEAQPADAEDRDARRISQSGLNPASFHDLDVEQPAIGLTRLASPDPIRLSLGELRALWQEGLAALRSPGAGTAARTLPVGRYRLAVIPSIRARSAGTIAIQGMPNKQVEMLTPSFAGSGSGSKIVVAAWVYENHSLAITYLDHMSIPRYICWDMATNQQHNFDAADEMNHMLYQLGLEAPDQLDRALSNRFRPRKPV
jgi:serine/threonine-protein kinase